jgi:hypothetical protein
MESGWLLLRDFTDAELIFDERETKDTLKFFFQADRQQIDALQVTNEMRSLAQGLLVEGVDATYAMGWIELTFRWVAYPGSGVKQALRKLAVRAARHWFKHLRTESLIDAKIYERVRDQLGRGFRSPFQIIIQAQSQSRGNARLAAFVNYGAPNRNDRAWG